MDSHTSQENQLLNVAFSLHSNPGAYALLLGAGVSAPSGIPTAWGVLEDLVIRAADLAGATPADPMAWYQDSYGAAPTYEGVLEHIAPTQIERQRLLRGYFEQDAEDVDTGRKLPTPAHRAIARLVRSEAVKVIVTLNFDHLIEQAIRAEGIEPTIVATPADIDGMAPLHTLDCCVIHLHGDYLNPTSMLNTFTELEAYHPSTQRLLQRILEDYGLIIAGWSATYDPALREAIAEHYPNRFTLTWFEPASPSEKATRLRILKKGIHVVQDADTGFGGLADGVTALATRRARHPLTIPVAVETAKRELSGRTVAIGLHDTLHRELDTLHRLPEFHLTNYNERGVYESKLARVEEATRLPAALIAALAYWGDATTDRWWLDEMPRFATRADGDGSVALLSLRVVSGTILFYTAGVAAVAAQRFDLLTRLFALKRPDRHRGGYETLSAGLDAERTYEEARNTRTRIFDVVAPLMASSLSLGEEPLEEAWQQFEILRLAVTILTEPRFTELAGEYKKFDRALAVAEEEVQSGNSEAQRIRAGAWTDRDRVLGDIGRLAPIGYPHILTADFRDEHRRYRSVTANYLIHDLRAEGTAHPLVTSGLFADVDHALIAIEAVNAMLGGIGRGQAWGRARNSTGFIPSQIWIDSEQTPQERTHRD
ncbi:SIR2 family protein [Brevibacterium gallinarum]|uniref:SIR2 family protein n=1 Tax=Brevibacterium gallinarum TaxID=2762220 RepID=A0ABR8WWZ6_9MICO|nr:SIR2 family protein [Brevibacterium gallinarum]MBD8021433.1 SIR2 family protein [Brevibacterium gallinarum]